MGFLSGNRQRYSLEYYPGRYSGFVERVEKVKGAEFMIKQYTLPPAGGGLQAYLRT
jgi:hypothetical protein